MDHQIVYSGNIPRRILTLLIPVFNISFLSPQNIRSLFAKEPIPADKNTRLTQH